MASWHKPRKALGSLFAAVYVAAAIFTGVVVAVAIYRLAGA